MSSMKKVIAALVALVLGGLLFTMFTQSAPFQGGPNGNGTANIFLAIEPTPGTPSTNPTPVTSIQRKPNTTFTVRPYVDLRGLTGANGSNQQVATQLAGVVITLGFDPNVLTLVNPNFPNGNDTVCTDPTLNPLFLGSTGKFQNQCNSYSLGPTDNSGNFDPKQGAISYVLSATGSSNPTGLLILPALTFRTSSTNNASTTLTFIPNPLPQAVKPTSIGASLLPGTIGGPIPFVNTDAVVTVAAAQPTLAPNTLTTTEGTTTTQTV